MKVAKALSVVVFVAIFAAVIFFTFRSSPNVSTLSWMPERWGLWLDDTFLFSTDLSSRKGRNLAARPDVAVHLESGDDVVIIDGSAEPLGDAAMLERYADAYEAKYGFRVDVSNGGDGIYCVRPRVVQAWREKDFPTSATRWRFPGG